MSSRSGKPSKKRKQPVAAPLESDSESEESAYDIASDGEENMQQEEQAGDEEAEDGGDEEEEEGVQAQEQDEVIESENEEELKEAGKKEKKEKKKREERKGKEEEGGGKWDSNEQAVFGAPHFGANCQCHQRDELHPSYSGAEALFYQLHRYNLL
jgi:ATP-dependent RNA helicase DDX18/HAS1